MKRTVLVKAHDEFAKVLVKDNGDCYDLVATEDCSVTPNKAHLISLGISMKLPSGCVAKIYDRSSTPLKRKIRLANSIGFIDNSYCSEKDIWKYQALSIKTGHNNPIQIKKGDRICQFEICLSQRATVYQKFKWLFTSGYKFKYVDSLDYVERGGFGSTEAASEK